MSFYSNHKKIIFGALLVFVLTGGIFILGASKTHAAGGVAGWLIDVPLTVVYTIILGVLSVIQKFFGAFLYLAAMILEGVLSLTTFTKAPVVVAGWTLTRGLCNMFLALILLIMAVATVLQIESFGVKKLLPRLVIVALLINFSLLFAGIVIDFSQVLTNYFINAAKGPNGSISTQLMAGLSMGNALNGNATSVTAPPGYCTADCSQTGQVCLAQGTGTGNYACGTPTNTNDIKQGDPGTLDVIIGYIFGIILTIIATFIILAAALLFIFRIVALWLILILSPLALVAWITGTGGIWNSWLKAFFKWTFFAPIYAFFIYLAVLSVSAVNVAATFGPIAIGMKPPGILNGIANSATLILQYITVAIILAGGLYTAQSLGITGAGAVMAWGKKAGKAASKWTVRKGTGYDAWSPKLMAAGGAIVGTIPGLARTGDIMKGKAEDMKEKQLQRRENVLLDKFIRKLPEADVLDRAKKDGGVKGLIASRVAYEKGYLKNADRETAQKAMETFRDFGMQKELQQLQETRVDAVKDPKDRSLALQRAVDSGAYKNWTAATFEGVEGQKLMNELQGKLTRSGSISAYKGWTASTREAAKKAMRANFNNDSSNEFKDDEKKTPAEREEIKRDLYRRDLYAACTDNIAHAYGLYSDPSEVKSGKLTEAGETAAAIHIQGRNASQIGDVGPGPGDIDDMILIGKHITEQQLTGIRGELGGEQKKYIMEGAKDNKDIKVKVFIENSPAWSGRGLEPKIEVVGARATVPPPEERKDRRIIS